MAISIIVIFIKNLKNAKNAQNSQTAQNAQNTPYGLLPISTKTATNMDKNLYSVKTAQCGHFDPTRPSLAYLRAENEFRKKWEISGFLAILEQFIGQI